jgi:septum site-determining protein MinC
MIFPTPSGAVAHSFDIKSTQLPMVALVPKTQDLRQVIADLTAQFGPTSDSPDFFDHDALVLDCAALGHDDLQARIGELVSSLAACRLKAIAFRNASPVQKEAALACGLIEAPEDLVQKKSTTARKAVDKPVVTTPVVIKEVVREVVREVIREVPGAPTMVIDKPLRSGQKVYARGADLVVLAMVNMGAEVVADGNIHVYAPLRGKAMAGASGNTNARIFSLCMEPELISIAGVYRTSENKLPAEIHGKSAQVRLSNDGQDKLLFEALNP